MSPTPEQLAREEIDAGLVEAGWVVQNRDAVNLAAGRGVAVREFPMKSGHGYADYLLFVNSCAVGVVEAKPQGHTLSGVEVRTDLRGPPASVTSRAGAIFCGRAQYHGFLRKVCGTTRPSTSTRSPRPKCPNR